MIGTNCGTGAGDMLKVIQRVEGLVSVPVIAQANAGLPQIKDGKTVYTETPEIYVQSALQMIERGVNAIGGCCGTTPDHIKLLHDKSIELKSYLARGKTADNFLKLSSRYSMHKIGFDLPFTIIGERLNPTARKALSKEHSGWTFPDV